VAAQRPDHANDLMNMMLLLKTGFVMAIFLILVLMGVHNRGMVDFNLPPFVSSVVQQPAALMYFGFFAMGVLTGTVLTFGVKRNGSPGPSKPQKPA
jgi:uncharacterized integral membrane protein